MRYLLEYYNYTYFNYDNYVKSFNKNVIVFITNDTSISYSYM